MFTKGKGQDGSTPTPMSGQDAIRPAAMKPNSRVVPSIISSDMKITGSVTSEGEMTIDGRIEGDVTADSLTIGVEGMIMGEIIAQQVVVRGAVKGSIRARKVDLEAGAKVHGDIVHARLAIQNDAVFEGQVKHAEDPLKEQGAQAATRAPSPTPAAAPTNAAPTTAPKPAQPSASAGTPSSGSGTPNS